MKVEKVIILGQTGSGKDHLLKGLIEKGLIPCIKTTTRPIRANETNGVNYNFIDNASFIDNIEKNEFKSYQKFNIISSDGVKGVWYYGITNEEFKKSQVLIMTPEEYENINFTKEQRNNLFVVYLDISSEIRKSRLLKRDDKNDSIKRRMDSDEIDFMNFNDFDLKITDPEFEPIDVYDLMY